MGGSKLLTDKAHRDGSPSRRNRTDVEKYADPRGVHAVNMQVTSELRKSSLTKESGGTSMKMLMAQEISKETESKWKQPNVVARLMGLDEALPTHQSALNSERCLEKSGHSSCVTLAGALQKSRQHDGRYLKGSHKKEYSDAKDHPLQRGRDAEIQSEMRMALVRRKFMEAKRLATDERLLQSKEFQDAVEVLSSNRDLFIKFLEEPNSLFSSHLKELHSIPAAPQTKRITVLNPLKTVEAKQQYPVKQPTRIVVLKPTSGRHNDTKTIIKNYGFDQVSVSEAKEPVGCRDIVKDVSGQMIDNINSNRRDESLLSSALSNGYIGDESSFNRSETDYEISSPISRHSWDYSNRFGSPYSFSSFSRASNSPEPSVIREAKKRLSERWSMIASNVNNREQMEVQRSSSTLGEMLAISKSKKEETRVRRSCDSVEDLRVSSASSTTYQTSGGNGGEKISCNLSRSKSLPVSSAYNNVGLNTAAPGAEGSKSVAVKDVAKPKRGKSSFKGQVSSLFFSRSKKVGRENSLSSPGVSSDDNLQFSSNEAVSKENDDLINQVYNGQRESCPPAKSEDEFMQVSSTDCVMGGSKQGSMSLKDVHVLWQDVLSLEKPNTAESTPDDCSFNKFIENQNQPSPTSVLDAPFEDNTSNNTPVCPEISYAKPSVAPLESIARTLSWDESNMEISLPDASKLPRTLREADAEAQQRFFYVQNILSTARLDNNMVFVRWHSIDSPLDPSLLDRFLDPKVEDAVSRKKRSDQRFIFDCINFALLEIGRAVYLCAYPWARVCSMTQKKATASASIVDEVWVLLSDWLSCEENLESSENDNSGLLVDKLLRSEVGGVGWLELMQSEIDEMSKEIGGAVLERLIEEALEDLAVECLL